MSDAPSFEKAFEELQARLAAEAQAAKDMIESDLGSPFDPQKSATPSEGDPKSDFAAEAAKPKPGITDSVSASESLTDSDTDKKAGTIKGFMKSGSKHMTSAEHAVRRLNEEFSLVVMGSDIRIARDCGDHYEFLKEKSFSALTQNDRVVVTTMRGSREVSAGEAWMKSEDRRTYDRVEFDPRGGTPKNVLNIWRGLQMKPIPKISLIQAARGCRLLLKHIRENLCRGSREEYRYFIQWCADLVQRPWAKSGVAVSISGRKGTGKTKVAEALTAVLGNYSTTVSQSRHLVGNFNHHLRQAILVVAEEAIWAGDKSAEGQLKHMITSTNLVTEQKGVDPIGIKNFARIMFIGNNPWIFPADEDERRLFALECGDKRQRDFGYFQAIDLELYGSVDGQSGNDDWVNYAGIRSFLTFLLGVDLSGFMVRKIPETGGLQNQRQSSLEPHAKFFLERLENRTIGFVRDTQFDHIFTAAQWNYSEEVTVLKRDIYEDYLRWHRTHNRSQPTSDNAFWRWVKKVFGWSTCRVGKAGFQMYAVKVDGWKYSHESFVKALKIHPLEGYDEEF